MTDTIDHLRYRIRVLPDQLERARARVAQLESEARRYRMFDLIGDAAGAPVPAAAHREV